MSNWHAATNKILTYSAEQQLLEQGDTLIVGLSGGPDSVFLTHWLAALRSHFDLNCHLAHVNYGLRGAQSDADETFCRDFAEGHQWPLAVRRLQASDYHGAAETNFQAWARQQRYDFFCELAEPTPQAKLVVAHQLTDQIETFFLRLLRGSGPSGLSAMRPLSRYGRHRVIRPLLCLNREEILCALQERDLDYRIDATNDSDRYKRNRLRQEVLPKLREIEPHFERLAGEALLLWQGEDAVLRDLAEKCLADLQLSKKEVQQKQLQVSRKGLQLLPLSLRLRILRAMIGELTGGPQSITFHHVRKIDDLVCRGPQEAQYDLPGYLLFEQGPLVVTLKVLEKP